MRGHPYTVYPRYPVSWGQSLAPPFLDAICSLGCEHSRWRHLLGAEALKEVKTPGVTLPDRLFGRYSAGPGRKGKATQSEMVRVQTSWWRWTIH
jgi:hypothetical protein